MYFYFVFKQDVELSFDLDFLMLFFMVWLTDSSFRFIQQYKVCTIQGTCTLALIDFSSLEFWVTVHVLKFVGIFFWKCHKTDSKTFWRFLEIILTRFKFFRNLIVLYQEIYGEFNLHTSSEKVKVPCSWVSLTFDNTLLIAVRRLLNLSGLIHTYMNSGTKSISVRWEKS